MSSCEGCKFHVERDCRIDPPKVYAIDHPKWSTQTLYPKALGRCGKREEAKPTPDASELDRSWKQGFTEGKGVASREAKRELEAMKTERDQARECAEILRDEHPTSPQMRATKFSWEE